MADEPSNAMTEEDLDQIFDMDEAPVKVLEDETEKPEGHPQPEAPEASEDGSTLIPHRDREPSPDAEPAPEAEPEPVAAKAEAEAKPKVDLSIQLDSVGEEPELEPQAAPDWLEALPEEQRSYIEHLRQESDGQRRALQRRREQISNLERERRQAFEVAHELRTKMQATPEPKAEPDTKAEPAPGGIAVQVTEDGQVIIPQEELQKLVTQQVQPQFAEQNQAMQADQERRSYGARILRDAGITDKTEEALATAYQDYVGLLQQEAVTRGVMPADRAQEMQLASMAGIESRLQQKYPDITVAALYDLQDGISSPQTYGHRLTDVAKRYQESWGLGAAPVNGGQPTPQLPPEKRQPQRAPKEHPGTLANAGTGAKLSADTALEGLDQIADNQGEALLEMVDTAGLGSRDDFWASVDKELGLSTS